MRLRFTKMHGLGNDFVMVDSISQKVHLTTERIQYIANRNFGIGCDQVLIVAPPETPDTDFYYRIFNSDGSEVENCGNGARCFARFVRQRGLTRKKTIRVGTAGGDLILTVNDNEEVTVDMGIPSFEPQDLPFKADQREASYTVIADNRHFQIGAVSMGNPHAVIPVENVSEFPVTHYGPLIEKHPLFSKGVNAGFMEVLSREHIKLRVFERGVGETLACGTGACAAAAHAITQGLADSTVRVELPGGSLTIEWQGEKHPLMMTGPATNVFSGQIRL